VHASYIVPCAISGLFGRCATVDSRMSGMQIPTLMKHVGGALVAGTPAWYIYDHIATWLGLLHDECKNEERTSGYVAVRTVGFTLFPPFTSCFYHLPGQAAAPPHEGQRASWVWVVPVAMGVRVLHGLEWGQFKSLALVRRL
jgi:hypothetical protein